MEYLLVPNLGDSVTDLLDPKGHYRGTAADCRNRRDLFLLIRLIYLEVLHFEESIHSIFELLQKYYEWILQNEELLSR